MHCEIERSDRLFICLLENKCPPIIKTRVRQRPHNGAFWKGQSCLRARGSQPINASSPHSG